VTLPASRPDYAIIAEWIRPRTRVLDLGCGDGTLLSHLALVKNVNGYGLEYDDIHIVQCIDNGVNVIQMNLDQGLKEFDDDSFEWVILSLTLPAMRRPELLLQEMLRVGREGIVTFPNFAHWRARIDIALRGRMPVTGALPHRWFDTPNIHLCTLLDFESLCDRLGIRILERRLLARGREHGPALRMLPNLLAETALYRFSR